MIPTATIAAVLIAELLTSLGMAADPRQAPAQAAAQATAADAAPFVGEWALALTGPDGAATYALTVKVEKDKVSGEMVSPQMGVQPVTDVALEGKSLRLRYSFDYQGMAVDTVVYLTPVSGGKVNAEMDFAGGAYVMTGTATKKEKAK